MSETRMDRVEVGMGDAGYGGLEEVLRSSLCQLVRCLTLTDQEL